MSGNNNWLHGASSVLKIPSPYSGSAPRLRRFELRICAKFYIPKTVAFRRFSFSINDIFIDTVEIYSNEYQNLILFFDVPCGFWFDKELAFKVEAEKLYTPSAMGDGSDKRELLCLIRELQFVEVAYSNALKSIVVDAGRMACERFFYRNRLTDDDRILENLFLKLKGVIYEKKPYSLIRLGDGEGRILGYETYFNQFDISREVLSYQFGRNVFDAIRNVYNSPLLHDPIEDLKNHIINSILNSDLIFIPSLIHFKEINDENLNAQVGQASSVLTVLKYRPDLIDVVEDHYIFRSFQRNGFFHKLLKDIEFLTLVSHSDCSQNIKNSFGVKNVSHIEIPGHATFMNANQAHFPDVYLKILNSITVQNPGELFFVAAGYLGKLYCNAIKQKGGIAIDIGSVFDGWVGIGRLDAIEDEGLRLL